MVVSEADTCRQCRTLVRKHVTDIISLCLSLTLVAGVVGLGFTRGEWLGFLGFLAVFYLISLLSFCVLTLYAEYRRWRYPVCLGYLVGCVTGPALWLLFSFGGGPVFSWGMVAEVLSCVLSIAGPLGLAAGIYATRRREVLAPRPLLRVMITFMAAAPSANRWGNLAVPHVLRLGPMPVTEAGRRLT
jgi:fumarate reductase subunit D